MEVSDAQEGGATDSFCALKMEFFEVMRRLHQVKPSPFELFEEVTPTEAHVLFMIRSALRCDDTESVRPGALAERMIVTPSALSQVLKALEGKGLIERRRGEEDSRAVSLVLTREGRDLADKIDACWSEQAHDIVEYVGIEDFRAMIGTALRVCEYLEKARAGELPSPFDREQRRDKEKGKGTCA